MKIICFDNNTPSTLATPNELPRFYFKPDTSLLLRNRPFYVPEFISDLRVRGALVLRIHRLGKYIQARFAHRYYNEVAVALEFFDDQGLRSLQAQGLPWDSVKAIDQSLAMSHFTTLESPEEINSLCFSFAINGVEKECIALSALPFFSSDLIENISTYTTLKMGDYLVVAFSSQCPAVKIGDTITVDCPKKNQLSCSLR